MALRQKVLDCLFSGPSSGMSILELVMNIDRKQYNSLEITSTLDGLKGKGFVDSVIMPSGTVLWLVTNDGKENLRLTEEEKKEQSDIFDAIEQYEERKALQPAETDDTTQSVESASTTKQNNRQVDVIFKYRPQSDNIREEDNPVIGRMNFEMLFPGQSFEEMIVLHKEVDAFLGEVEENV